MSKKSVAAVEPITTSAMGQVSRQLFERHRRAVKLARQLDRAVERAVGEHQAADAAVTELPRGELGHLAGADQHRRLVVESDSKICIASSTATELTETFAAADAGLAAHALGDGERLVEARGAGPLPAVPARPAAS